MVKLDLSHEEGEELDRRIDLVNVVFGAALGGYIGVVMTRKDLTLNHSIVLALVLLIIVVCLLVAIRNILHVLARHHVGDVEAAAGGRGARRRLLRRTSAATPISTSRCWSPIFIGWVIAFAVVVSAHVIVCKETDQ